MHMEITIRVHSDSVSAGNASYIADNGEILPFGGQVEDISTPSETVWKIKITLPISLSGAVTCVRDSQESDATTAAMT